MVEVGEVTTQAEQTGNDDRRGGLQPLFQTALPQGTDEEADDEECHDEEEIVGHLQVVADELEGGEEGCNRHAFEEFPAIAENQTGDGGRDESERQHFPEVTGGNDDEEIGGERPHHRTGDGKPGTDAEGAEQDIEAKQIEKEETDGGEPLQRSEGINLGEGGDGVGGGIGGCHLEGGHAAEDGVAPTGDFAVVALAELSLLLSESLCCDGVMTAKHEPLTHGRQEVEGTEEEEDGNGDEVGEPLTFAGGFVLPLAVGSCHLVRLCGGLGFLRIHSEEFVISGAKLVKFSIF